HLSSKKEPRLSKALCELVDGGAEYTCGLLAHVLDRVDAKAVEVGVGDPVLVTVDEVLESWRRCRVLRAPVDRARQLLEVIAIRFTLLRREFKSRDPGLGDEAARVLYLSGPDRAIGPRRVERCPVGRIEREYRPALAVAEAFDGVRVSVPSRVRHPLAVS